jgi:hypothetical protein
MLLPPELGEKRGKKPVEDLKPVNQGVVRRAEGDEQLFAGDAGPAVVDVEKLPAFRLQADAAAVAVAPEDSRAQSAEMEKIAPLGGITGPAEAPQKRRRGSAGPAP